MSHKLSHALLCYGSFAFRMQVWYLILVQYKKKQSRHKDRCSLAINLLNLTKNVCHRPIPADQIANPEPVRLKLALVAAPAFTKAHTRSDVYICLSVHNFYKLYMHDKRVLLNQKRKADPCTQPSSKHCSVSCINKQGIHSAVQLYVQKLNIA